MIPLNIHFKVSKHPTCHMARLHPVAVQMFSKDLLVPLSGHMPFCLALYQNRAKVIPRPKELMGSAARDTHSQTGAPWKQWGNTSCTRAWKCLAYRKENLYEALKKDNEEAHQVLWWHLSLQEATKRVQRSWMEKGKNEQQRVGPLTGQGWECYLLARETRARATGIMVKSPGVQKESWHFMYKEPGETETKTHETISVWWIKTAIIKVSLLQ